MNEPDATERQRTLLVRTLAGMSFLLVGASLGALAARLGRKVFPAEPASSQPPSNAGH